MSQKFFPLKNILKLFDLSQITPYDQQNWKPFWLVTLFFSFFSFLFFSFLFFSFLFFSFLSSFLIDFKQDRNLKHSLPSSPSSPPSDDSLLLTLPNSMEEGNVFSPRPLHEGELKEKKKEKENEEKKEKEEEKEKGKEKEEKQGGDQEESEKEKDKSEEEKEGVEEEVLRSISNELDDRVRCFVWSLLGSVDPSVPLLLHSSHPGFFFFFFIYFTCLIWIFQILISCLQCFEICSIGMIKNEFSN